MPSVKLPIRGYPYQNIDDTETSVTPAALIDGYVNENNTYVKRPGLAEFVDLATGVAITGLYHWADKDIVVVVSNQNIYSITEAGFVTDITNDQLTGINRTVFAEVYNLDDASNYLVMADGGNIIYWDGGAGTTTQIADVDAPTNVTFVANIDGYLLANNGDKKFYHSDLNDFDSWSALSFYTAETHTDNVDAVTVLNREVFLHGKHSTEVWYSTGDTPVLFSRKIGAEILQGCIAPYTIQEAMETLIWLNHDRKVVARSGNKTQILSIPIDQQLANLTTVTDARADVVKVEGRGFYVITFPTDQKTYAYDYQNQGWAEWAYWDGVTSTYEDFRGAVVIYVPEWGKYLVGDKSNGKVHTMDASHYDDDGDTIRFLLKSGHINHGTHQKKRSNRLLIKSKRGVATAGETTPEVAIRWRTDGGNWGNQVFKSLGLGQIGENEFYTTLYRLGMYRSRQYEIVQTDNVEFRLIEMEEEIEGLTT